MLARAKCYIEVGGFALHGSISGPSERYWAASSVGRAPRSQRGGRGFEPHAVHQDILFRINSYRQLFESDKDLTSHSSCTRLEIRS